MHTKIKEYRKRKGLTQQQLAELVGVTRQTINALENGHYNPSLILAHNISETLGSKHIEDIFIFDEEEEE